jgi:hypothetical protein
MIRTTLKGGLGNQMFQYAAAKSLAIEKSTELYLDLSFLTLRLPIKGFTVRDYELDLFGITDKTGTFFENIFADKYFSYPFELFINKSLNKEFIVEGEDPYEFNGKFFDLSSNATLEGYWNNPKYFEKHAHTIKKAFDLDKFYDGKFDEIESKIKNSNSVSVNIRRGDYLNSKHKDIFIFLDENYYKEAIFKIRERIEKPHFFVFSYDDPQWFEETFKMDKSEYTMMGKEYVGEKFKTYLRLISLCKNNIISNSTFAWWGAYLNKNQNKIVVSPKKWMQKYDFENLPEWITLEN